MGLYGTIVLLVFVFLVMGWLWKDRIAR